MKLSSLLDNVKIKYCSCSKNIEIESISINSKKCVKNCVFICIKGINTDGNNYIDEAIKNGAVCIVSEHLLDINIPHIVVENAQISLAIMASNYYGNPKEKLKIIGVTGTNGKTTCVNIISQILQRAGKKVATIGTLGAFCNNKKIYHNLTTPDTLDLHEILNYFVSQQIEYVIMEISAHAIALNKIYGIIFEYCLYTNLSQDHLDFFQTMQRYAETKKTLFNTQFTKCGIINADDGVGQQIIQEEKIPIITYGLKQPSDCFAIDIMSKIKGSTFSVNILDNIYSVQTNLIGEHNIYNCLACMTLCSLIGIADNIITQALKQIKNIDGRFNVVKCDEKYIIVDFAHTPDALEKTLSTCKSVCEGKIITVFGCPGSRDTSKRKLMAKVVEKYSNFVIVTSDNPKYENIDCIYKDICEGFTKQSHKHIPNREQAIKFAFFLAKKDDFVVVCGKGGEYYQDINGVKIPYSDKQSINVIIGECNA